MRNLFIIMAILLGLGAGKLGYSKYSEPSGFQSVQFIPIAMALPMFALADVHESPVTASNFKGHWSLVYFGFSNCPDMCPMALQNLDKILHQLPLAKKLDLQVVFISLDPERDTAARLAAYVANINPEIIALTGNNHELAKLSHFFSVDYSRQVNIGAETINVAAGENMPIGEFSHYQLEHSGRIFIVSPAANYWGSFAPPHDFGKLLSDLQMIIK